MLILESGEICPYALNCPYNKDYISCHGAKSNRDNKFTCELVENGKFKHGTRLSEDKTGKMKVIME
jgi:hypothetical protein